MDRQGILASDAPPTLHVVLDEAAMYREVGGGQAMFDQLQHLSQCVSERLTVQIIPSDVNPCHIGAFVIATIDGSGEVAYIETAVRGIVTSSRDDVTHLNGTWEKIRSHALSQRESLNFIRRTAEERWA
jgi:uncharacterized protein DUF5753